MISKLFAIADKDQSGTLSFEQFLELLRFMNLAMSRERALHLFVSVDPDGSGDLTPREFSEGFSKLEDELARDALSSVGLTFGNLVSVFIAAVSLLAALFAFIFLGISGLTEGSEFGAVVNSILPCAAGLGAALSQRRDNSNYDLKQVVKSVFKKMRAPASLAGDGGG